jgi:hypothetical protein
MNWTHDNLANDLAAYFMAQGFGWANKKMVWTNIPIGPSGSQRPDVYVMDKSFTKPDPRTFEVKVNRADFLADVGEGKWQGYLAFSTAVTFAAPEGLIQKNEMPELCGLMVRGDGGWRTLKKARPSGKMPATEHMIRLLINAFERQEQANAQGRFHAWHSDAAVRKKHGDLVANAVRNLEDTHEKIRVAQLQLEAIKADSASIAEKAKEEAERAVRENASRYSANLNDIREALDLPRGATDREIINGMRHWSGLGGVRVNRHSLENIKISAERLVCHIAESIGGQNPTEEEE